MIAIDGTFYVARADGRVSPIPPDSRTPFAVVVPWHTDGGWPLAPAATLEALAADIDLAVPPDGGMLAVRIDGHFSRVLARSVPRQSPPYATLFEVAASRCSSSCGISTRRLW